jgi:nitrogen fixation/metabolism regulation signal transduction histidine kinase
MSDQPVDAETMRTLRHDIKNQLSNIHLALETLRYEITDPTEDCTFCIETIFNSAAKINALLKQPE